jgi:hypothetical protein
MVETFKFQNIKLKMLHLKIIIIENNKNIIFAKMSSTNNFKQHKNVFFFNAKGAKKYVLFVKKENIE